MQHAGKENRKERKDDITSCQGTYWMQVPCEFAARVCCQSREVTVSKFLTDYFPRGITESAELIRAVCIEDKWPGCLFSDPCKDSRHLRIVVWEDYGTSMSQSKNTTTSTWQLVPGPCVTIWLLTLFFHLCLFLFLNLVSSWINQVIIILSF